MDKVATGGTFAVIHDGHKALFSECAKLRLHTTVGITVKPLVSKYHVIPDFQTRCNAVTSYFKINLGFTPEVVGLTDHAGPLLSDPSYKHLVTSEENLPYACFLNFERARLGFPLLNIIVVETVRAFDGRPISTTRIFNGEIDSSGKLAGHILVETKWH